MISNDLILLAAKGLNASRTPVWMMRQAGRVLVEYKKIREKFKNFKDFVKNPEAAAEVTKQPVDIFGVDAAIIFSDILVVPEAMGLPYEMSENKGPYFNKAIENQKHVNELADANPEIALKYVLDAIKLSKQMLQNAVPLIGFAGAPWTIFAYITEGGGSKTFSKARKMLYTQPELSHLLLEKITLTTTKYLIAQIKAGADMVQLFDSWAGILPKYQYDEFAMPYIQKIVEELKKQFPNTPITVFAKDAWFALPQIAEINTDVIGLDWNMSPSEAKFIVKNKKTLQGNLDPCVLYADKQVIKKYVENMLLQFGNTRHIANLGHGLYPDIERDKIKYFVEVVQNFRH